MAAQHFLKKTSLPQDTFFNTAKVRASVWCHSRGSLIHFGNSREFYSRLGTKPGMPFPTDFRLSNSSNSNSLFKLLDIPHTLTEIP